jgi:replicative DNA helicase
MNGMTVENMNQTNMNQSLDSIEKILNMQGVENPQVGVIPAIQESASIHSLFPESTPFFKTRMLQTIAEVDDYSWKRGEMGGLDWGYENFNKAFEGLNTGVHLIAGQSNVGKSGICIQLALQIAKANLITTPERPKKAFVVYFSLDDSNNELMPRIVAIDQRIPINAVRFPKKYQDDANYMERRTIGFENLKNLTDHIAMHDVNDGSDIEYIEETAEKYFVELQKISEEYQLVLIIDNFHDVTVRDVKFGSDSNGKYDFIADRLTRIATKFDCPIICTAEFRKLNGNRRPILDDIRESTKIVYEAKAILLCYNEVGLRGQQANIFWQSPDVTDKRPVFEAHVGKNKFGSYKGRMFFEFVPEMSYFREVVPAAAIQYAQRISG